MLQVKVQHKENLRLFEAQHCDLSRTFGIQHYAGRVVYDTTDFLGKRVMMMRTIMPIKTGGVWVCAGRG